MVVTKARRPASILIIEPDATLRDLIQSVLYREGHQVTSFASGHVALADAAIHRPDLIILSLRLPLIAAESVMTALRMMYGVTPRVVALATSGNSSHTFDANRLKEATVVQVPFEPATLAAVVSGCLEVS